MVRLKGLGTYFLLKQFLIELFSSAWISISFYITLLSNPEIVCCNLPICQKPLFSGF